MRSYQNTAGDPTKRWLGLGLAALLTTSVAIGQTVTRSADSDEEDRPIVLSPFTVESEADFGYVKTNSLTATRIGARIMDTPLQIQVLSEDFIQDTNMTDISDVLRYSATSGGDNQMGILQPATGFTPSGIISTRGFPINARLRNSIRRYNVYSLDNVERVELIRGPASVFFGQSFPGGVINYVTKQAEFRNIPTTASYRWTTDGGNKATYDQNTVLLRDRIAFRNFLSWENSSFQRDFERRQGFTIAPQVKIQVNDKLTIRAELEYTERRENLAAHAWMWPQGWFDAYANPPVALMNAANINPALTLAERQALYRTRIGDQRVGNWMADVRNAAGDQGLPIWTNASFMQGATFQAMEGNRKFNPHGRDSTTDEEVTNVQVQVEYQPFDWLNSRYTWNRAHAYYHERKSQARPNADGQTYNTLVGLVWRFYDVAPENHIFDNIVSFDLGPTKNKFLFGGIYRRGDNQFGGISPAPATGAVTGAPVGTNFEGVPGVGNPGARNLQALRDRNGNLMDALQVFTHYDPTIHPFPGIARITERARPVIDRYRPRNAEWYVNYQGAFFEDRLNVMAGYREEKTYNRQQQLRANPPWYDTLEGANSSNQLEILGARPGGLAVNLPIYEVHEGYNRGLLTTLSGDSIQYGATFALTPDVNIYAGYSQSYLPNGGTKAIWDETAARVRATELGRNPDTEVARVRAQGGDASLNNEEGTNAEVGIKTTLFDNKIVATVSLFRLERTNRRTDDVGAQTDEPLNYNAAGARTGNIVRWFSAEATQRTEGTEFEVIWTPNRNYQLVGSAGYLWTAKTVADPSVAPANVNHNAVFNTRLVGAPKHSLNIWNKYTFTEGGLAGFTVGGGMRYRSEMTISQSRDWDASRGGVTSGDYTVFDALFGYNTEIWGMQTNFSLNITNVFDKMYMEGGWNYARGREIALTTRLTF